MFLGVSGIESVNFVWKWRRYVGSFMWTNKCFTDLLESCFLFEILYTSVTVTTTTIHKMFETIPSFYVK